MRNLIKLGASSIALSMLFSGCLLKDSVDTPESLRGLKQGEFLKFAFEMKLNEAELQEYKFQEEFKAMNLQLQAQREFLNSSYEDYFLNKAPKDEEKMEQFKLEYQRDTGKVWQGF
jgi:Fe-S cluster assembly ATPase SufC